MEGETAASIASQMQLFNERVLPTLDSNIKDGNSLIDIDFYETALDFGEEKKIKPFCWRKAFPEAFERDRPIGKTMKFKKHFQAVKKLSGETSDFVSTLISEDDGKYTTNLNGGFDVVIGNPPYVRVSDKNMIEYFNLKYHHQDYQQDLYLLFLEKYKNLLIIGGKLGVIIPNTWLQSIKFRNIRRYLINDYYWDKILTFSNRVFEAIVDTHVIIFEKNSFIKNTSILIDYSEKGVFSNLQQINQYNLPQDGDIINVVSNLAEKDLFEKIKIASVTLKNETAVFNGVKPFEKGKGKPAQTEKTLAEKPYVVEHNSRPKGKTWLPLLRGNLMNRYSNFWKENSWIDYGVWLAAPRNPAIFQAEEKIVVRQTGDSIIATIIGKDIICRNNLHIIISNHLNHKFILGLLNSKMMNFYYTQINPEKGEALAEVKKNHVEQLPIPKSYSEAVYNSLIVNVDNLLHLYEEFKIRTLDSQKQQIKAKIEYHEDKINEIVYQIYGLSQDEIKIIENA
jgi:hypothetical protein